MSSFNVGKRGVSRKEEDAALDQLLGKELALGERPVDAAFVARVDHGIAELERYRLRRTGLLRRLTGDVFSIGALGGSLALIAQAPEVRGALVEAPLVAWPALLSLLVFWIVLPRGKARMLA
jgi:hypothetical protein